MVYTPNLLGIDGGRFFQLHIGKKNVGHQGCGSSHLLFRNSILEGYWQDSHTHFWIDYTPNLLGMVGRRYFQLHIGKKNIGHQGCGSSHLLFRNSILDGY